ncbi:MAG: mannitol dehydrogenase [Ruminococcaceae bacterium]|nr:mannitol dehydrogenase [Oscillospiraceae bacterium]
MKKAVMYGGGNIGRGFIGQLMYQAGYAVSFVDVNKELLEALNTQKQYPVRILKGDSYDEVMVQNVSGIDGNDIDAVSQAIAEADLCATAVGVNVLKFVVKPIKEGIVRRFTQGSKKPLDIIICENLIGADEFLKGMISDLMTDEERSYLDKVGFVEASIGRMVPIQTDAMKDGNPLRVCVERYDRLPVDKAAFRGELPPIENLVPFTPFSYYIERKLFVHNMGHASTAYLGQYMGCDAIWESIGHPEVELIVLRAMQASALAMSKKYNVPYQDLNNHVENLVYRFSNRQLGDTNARVGGDIKRKLSPNDRMIGAFRLCCEQGVATDYLELAIAASLLFRREGEEPMTPETILTEVAVFSKTDAVYTRIMDYYEMLQNKMPLSALIKAVKNKQSELVIV